MKIIKLRVVLTCFTALLALGVAQTQVSLSPTSVFINDNTNIESLNISNRGDGQVEVNVRFEFSYPGYDDHGNMISITNDSLAAQRYSLTDNLRVFPRSFVIQPRGQQVVRLQVRPMREKPEGMYWARIIVSSNAPAADIETVTAAEGVGTRVNFVFNQNIPVYYSKGNVITGLDIINVKAYQEIDQLVSIVRLKPTGNSPYNGSVTAMIRDNNGQVVAEHQTINVVYFEALRRVAIPFPDKGLPPGNYSLELMFETRRRDISPSKLVQAQPVSYIIPVQLK